MIFLTSTKALWSSSINKLIIAVTILLYVGITVFIVYGRDMLPPEIPLYYSLTHGETQLATQDELTGIPILILALIIGNYLVALSVQGQWPALGRMLLLCSLIVCLLMTITIFKIATLVI